MTAATDTRIETKNAKVWFSYPQDEPPAHSGAEWTRFICLSDTHSSTFPVPNGDILLHAGDLSSWGTSSQLKKTMDWLMELPHPKKIIVAGNHDYSLDLLYQTQQSRKKRAIPKDTEVVRGLVGGGTAIQAGIRYLESASLEFVAKTGGRSWKVYGSPASPWYSGGAFQHYDEDAKDVFSQIPDDIDILITHTPPRGILDLTRDGVTHAGDKELAKRLPDLTKCRLHVFGHIHEGRGAHVRRLAKGREETVFVNAAGRGKPDTQPIIVDLRDDIAETAVDSLPT